MRFEKKMKIRGNEKLDARAKNPYKTAIKTEKTHSFPLWAKITIPSSVLAGALVAGIVVPIAMHQSGTVPYNPSSSVLTLPNSQSSVQASSQAEPSHATGSNLTPSISSGPAPGNPVEPGSPIGPSYMLNNPQKPFNVIRESLKQAYADSVSSFAEDFYQAAVLKKKNADDNIIFSPLSMAACFGMAYEGALGETKQEMADAFHMDEEAFSYMEQTRKMLLNTSRDLTDKENSKRLYSNVSDALFANDTFKDRIKKDYIDILTANYFAEAFSGQLASDEMHEVLANYINEKTNDFFDLKKEDFRDLEGILWLVNTVYLKANWAIDFYRDSSVKEFHSLSGEAQNDVSYIVSSLNGTMYEWEDAYRFNIPLYGGLYYMSVLYPKEEANQQQLSAYVEKLLKASGDPEVVDAQIIFRMPEFKSVNSFDLIGDDFLSDLGIKAATNPAKADFSGIADSLPGENIYISAAKHAAGIDVNIDGVEAAAYTVIGFDETAVEPQGKLYNLTLDRPFLYSINENSNNLPLFVGQLSSI